MRSVIPLLVLLSVVLVSRAQNFHPLDTTQPNEFYFTQDVYYVDEDATNAIITVGFNPGNSGFSGSVNFFTADGSATAGEDYAAVSGTLYFSGPAPRSFNVPIKLDGITESNETVQLFLSNPNAFLSRSNATLVIIDKSTRPKLNITTSSNSITVAWPTNCTGFSPEVSNGMSGGWLPIAAKPVTTNGCFMICEPIAANRYYRLHCTNSP